MHRHKNERKEGRKEGDYSPCNSAALALRSGGAPAVEALVEGAPQRGS